MSDRGKWPGPQVNVTFGVDHRHEGVVEVDDGESGVLGFIVEAAHGLSQELVVEHDEEVGGCVTLLEGGRVGRLGEASQRL